MPWKKKTFSILFIIIVLFGLTACESVVRKIELEDPYPSLANEYLKHGYFDIGVAVNANTINTHRDLIEKHFNSVTAENEMKPESILPHNYNKDFDLDFSRGDTIVEFAKENGMKVRGHTLVWHDQTPNWFFEDGTGNELPKDKLLERMKKYIKEVVTHYKGDIYAWDVVNEAISENSGNANEIYRSNSKWNETFRGNEIEYIAKAFVIAHEADPDAKLFYNDYNAVRSDKRKKIIAMLEDLIENEVPIDGIGIQGHWQVDWPSIQDIEDAIIAYSGLGLDIQITELDIKIFTKYPSKELLEKQAKRYKEIFELFIKHSDKISGVTFWGVSDETSWYNFSDSFLDDSPLIFDQYKKPKPAYWAILEALEN